MIASPDKQTMNMKDGSDVIGDWLADGTAKARERLQRVLTGDTGLGVTRLADAGYELAIQTIKEEAFHAPLA